MKTPTDFSNRPLINSVYTAGSIPMFHGLCLWDGKNGDVARPMAQEAAVAV
jgi:hypothetical protein